jgi:hypothetical protein
MSTGFPWCSQAAATSDTNSLTPLNVLKARIHAAGAQLFWR